MYRNYGIEKTHVSVGSYFGPYMGNSHSGCMDEGIQFNLNSVLGPGV